MPLSFSFSLSLRLSPFDRGSLILSRSLSFCLASADFSSFLLALSSLSLSLSSSLRLLLSRRPPPPPPLYHSLTRSLTLRRFLPLYHCPPPSPALSLLLSLRLSLPFSSSSSFSSSPFSFPFSTALLPRRARWGALATCASFVNEHLETGVDLRLERSLSLGELRAPLLFSLSSSFFFPPGVDLFSRDFLTSRNGTRRGGGDDDNDDNDDVAPSP